jgi:hypothetical protein
MLKKTIVHWVRTLVSHVSWMIIHNLPDKKIMLSYLYSPSFHRHRHDVPIGSRDDLMMLLTWCLDVVPFGSHDVNVIHITFGCCSFWFTWCDCHSHHILMLFLLVDMMWMSFTSHFDVVPIVISRCIMELFAKDANGMKPGNYCPLCCLPLSHLSCPTKLAQGQLT